MFSFKEWLVVNEAVPIIERPPMELSQDSGEYGSGYARRMNIVKKVGNQETTDDTQDKYQNRVSDENL